MKWNFRILLVVIVTLGVTALLGVSSQAWNSARPATQDDQKLQASAANPDGPISRQAVGFGISPAVRDLPEAQNPRRAISPDLIAKAAANGGSEREINRRNTETLKEVVPGAGAGFSPFVDEALSPSVPSVVPTPAVSFDGLSSQDNQTVFGSTFAPPDSRHRRAPGRGR